MTHNLSVKQPKRTTYTEHETAASLGLSVEQLRTLIREDVIKNQEELAADAIPSFNTSDLVMLRMLAQTRGLSRV